jgi:hypothetical protein
MQNICWENYVFQDYVNTKQWVNIVLETIDELFSDRIKFPTAEKRIQQRMEKK